MDRFVGEPTQFASIPHLELVCCRLDHAMTPFMASILTSPSCRCRTVHAFLYVKVCSNGWAAKLTLHHRFQNKSPWGLSEQVSECQWQWHSRLFLFLFLFGPGHDAVFL